MVNLLDRVELDGAFGTVKYIGRLPVWGDDVEAFGIEWDDASRGKNDGKVGNIRYFSVDQPGSGSFVKAGNRKLKVGQEFVDVFLETYTGTENALVLQKQIVFGSKKVESLGFEELNRQRAELALLESVMVDKKAIGRCGSIERLPVLLNVKYLDLSYNLLVDMAEVEKMVERMPLLRVLNVNGNVLRRFGEVTFGLVETVHAASCGLEEERLGELLSCFPGLQRLCVAGNRLGSLLGVQVPPGLDLLDLSFNRLEKVPEIHSRELILANNQISTLSGGKMHTEVLDLRENPVGSWKDVDFIGEKFPVLMELRIDGCAVFDGLSVDEMTTQLIGRLPCLVPGEPGILKINGSTLLADEIRSAELYVISKVQKGEISIHTTRWRQLQRKYNVGEVSETKNLPTNENRMVLTIKTSNGVSLLSRTFLPSNTVLRLKGIITKHTSVPVHRFNLYYYPNGIRLPEDDVSKTYLDDDVATLASAGLENQNHVFYEPYP